MTSDTSGNFETKIQVVFFTIIFIHTSQKSLKIVFSKAYTQHAVL